MKIKTMKAKTFQKYVSKSNIGMPHDVLGIRACDSTGEVFKIEVDELSNDWATTEHSNSVRNLIAGGYTEVGL